MSLPSFCGALWGGLHPGVFGAGVVCGALTVRSCSHQFIGGGSLAKAPLCGWEMCVIYVCELVRNGIHVRHRNMKMYFIFECI